MEVLFTRERFTFMLSYLAFTLPTTFSALIHQLTSDQVNCGISEGNQQPQLSSFRPTFFTISCSSWSILRPIG